MREEWELDIGPGSSWTTGRLRAAAATVAAGALVLGLGLGRLFTPASVAATEAVPTEVAGAVEEAPATELLDPTAAVREGDDQPGPTEHLAVVQVSVSVCDARSTGSGFVVADGLVLTAAHVVGDAGLVRLDHQGTTVTGEVLGVFADGRDVALIAVETAPGELPATGPVPATGSLTLVGHPDGGPRTAAVGPIVDVAPVVASLAGGGDIVGVDVTISEGISGGPAIDATGAVVGIVVAKETQTDTALVLALPELASIESVPLVAGACPGTA